TGRRAADLLARILAGETLHCAWRRLPFVIPMPWQSTLADPGAHLLDAALSLQNESVRLAQFIPGFPLADIRDCGPSVLVYASTATWAARAADTLYEEALRARTGFGGRLLSVDDALRHTLAGQRKLILADTQDNPGGGGSGDTTDLLRALLQGGVRAACAGIVCDPEFAAMAHATGVGHTLNRPLGGRSGV